LDSTVISRPDRVQIWAGQLAAKDLPMVCAMTGRPAETWRKFQFTTPSVWVVTLLLVLTVLDLRGPRPKVRQARGHLPLTKSASELAMLVETTSLALLPLSVLLLVGGIVIQRLNTAGLDLAAISRNLVVIGLVLLLAFVVSAVLRNFVGLGAKVLAPPPGYGDQLVELRRVHPAFVAAVNDIHRIRAEQFQSTHAPTNSPTPPGST
jgi:hypothetical protein